VSETTRHRQAFDVYWQLGAERSIERLHHALRRQGRAPSLRTLYEWSRSFHWQRRLLDLERKAREAEDAARVAAIREMTDRQSKEALLLQQQGASWLTSIDPEQVSADAAIRAIVEGARLERLVRGEPTDRPAVQGTVNRRLEGLTDGELDRLLELAGADLAGEGAPQPQ